MEEARFMVETSSPRETKLWGRRLGSLLQGGELIALMGDLGAGKTCLIKGLARGLRLGEEQILSPTFTMIQEHRGRLPLYHIDLYRLEAVALDDLGLREYVFSEGVAAVEWFDRLRDGERLSRLAIRMAFAGATRRTIEFAATGEPHYRLIDRLKSHSVKEASNAYSTRAGYKPAAFI
jgi:tRNA threonylcarbamoyladenosine biosynthesis protein TsaE